MNRLGDFGSDDGVDAFRRRQGHQPGANPQGCPGHQAGGPHITPGAGDNQQMSEGAFVGVKGPGGKLTPNPARSQQLQVNRLLLGHCRGQADIDHLKPPYAGHAGEGQQTDFRKSQGHGDIDDQGCRVNITGIGVDSGG